MLAIAVYAGESFVEDIDAWAGPGVLTTTNRGWGCFIT